MFFIAEQIMLAHIGDSALLLGKAIGVNPYNTVVITFQESFDEYIALNKRQRLSLQ